MVAQGFDLCWDEFPGTESLLEIPIKHLYGALCNSQQETQPPLALAVPLSRFTPRVGGGSAFFVRHHYTLMKKLAIIGLLVVVVVACLLLYWQHVTVARFDSDFHQQLAGVWLRQEADMRCTNSVTADGSFVELSWFSHTDRTNTYQRTGTWLVKDGRLIETVSSSSNSAEVTPHTGAARIIRSDAGEFVLRWPNSVEQVWQKITP
jgi:uncharacterized membrane protein (Fun14 family)